MSIIQSIIDRAFLWSAKNKILVIHCFQVFWAGLIMFSYFGGRSIYYADKNFLYYYAAGINAGRIALVLFIVALLPGMANRFGIRHKLLAIIMFFRRHIGITTYLFALIHFSFLKIIRIFSLGRIIFPVDFEWYGFFAHVLLFLLFITSNNFSQNKLNVWWYRLHRLIYIAMWLIFLHVAIQRWSIWSISIGVVVILQMTSFIYAKKHTGQFLPH